MLVNCDLMRDSRPEKRERVTEKESNYNFVDGAAAACEVSLAADIITLTIYTGHLLSPLLLTAFFRLLRTSLSAAAVAYFDAIGDLICRQTHIFSF